MPSRLDRSSGGLIPADLFGCRLLGAGVAVGEGPVEGGDINAAPSLVHESQPGLEDGGVSGAGVKLQTFRDALHQNNAEEEKEKKGKEGKPAEERRRQHLCFVSVLTCRGLSRFGVGRGCCSGMGGGKEP